MNNSIGRPLLTVCIALLLLSGCGTKPDYHERAQYTCGAMDYGYDNAIYKNCVVYETLYAAKIESGQAYPAFAEFLCEKGGIKNDADDFDACLQAKNKILAEAKEKAARELAKAIRRRDEEARIAAQLAEKQRREAAKEQLSADASQCKNWGFKKGTDKFAECMMKIQQARTEEQNRQQQAYQAEQQQSQLQEQYIAAQQEAARRQVWIGALSSMSQGFAPPSSVHCQTGGNVTDCQYQQPVINGVVQPVRP